MRICRTRDSPSDVTYVSSLRRDSCTQSQRLQQGKSRDLFPSSPGARYPSQKGKRGEWDASLALHVAYVIEDYIESPN